MRYKITVTLEELEADGFGAKPYFHCKVILKLSHLGINGNFFSFQLDYY